MVVAYQDDIYVLVKPEHNGKVVRWAEELLAGVGLKLNASKADPNLWTLDIALITYTGT